MCVCVFNLVGMKVEGIARIWLEIKTVLRLISEATPGEMVLNYTVLIFVACVGIF